MQIQLGEKIKSLRKQKNISQEVLANYLGVTFQAVSKWENGATMPDVTMIPAIASFFGVSTDELFDFNRYETEERVMEICRLSWKYRHTEPEKAEKILKDGLAKYPGNEIILNNLLYVMRLPDRAQEAIELCQALIEGTKYDDVRYDACRILAEAYQSVGEYQLMKAAIENIPEIYFTKLELDAKMLAGDDAFEAAEKQKRLSADSLVDMLRILADKYEEKGEPENAVVQLGIAKSVIEAFREDVNGSAFTKTLYQAREDEIKEIDARIEKLMKKE